jgi:hypothetical protein
MTNKKRMCYPAAVPPKVCLITVTDARGIRHTAEVSAESMFEAAVLGLAALKSDEWTERIGPATRLEVKVQAPAVTHVLSVLQIHRWLDGVATSPKELSKKKTLKALLGIPKVDVST